MPQALNGVEQLVSKDFTARMEEDLDAIAEGKLGRVSYLEVFWTNGLERDISRASRRTPVLGIPKIPGATCTAHAGVPLLTLNGQHVPLPDTLAPDELNPEILEAMLSGRWRAAAGGTRKAATTPQAGSKAKRQSGKSSMTGKGKARSTRRKTTT